MTTKVHFVYIEDDDVGEVEGMFLDDGTMLGTWCCNDASWRSEYFNGFMEALGVQVVNSDDESLEEKLKAHWLQ